LAGKTAPCQHKPPFHPRSGRLIKAASPRTVPIGRGRYFRPSRQHVVIGEHRKSPGFSTLLCVGETPFPHRQGPPPFLLGQDWESASLRSCGTDWLYAERPRGWDRRPRDWPFRSNFAAENSRNSPGFSRRFEGELLGGIHHIRCFGIGGNYGHRAGDIRPVFGQFTGCGKTRSKRKIVGTLPGYFSNFLFLHHPTCPSWAGGALIMGPGNDGGQEGTV